VRAIPARRLLRFRRRLPLRRVVPAAGAVCRVRAGCVSAVRYAGDRARPGAAAGFLRGTVGRRRSSEDCTVGDCLPDSIRSVERERKDWNSIRRRVPAKAPARAWEVWEMSCRRAHRESVRRLVLVSGDPLAPDTDLHHRRIRECRVDCRTDGTSGRDEKDVGVRSCSCGVAEKKSAARWLTGTAGQTHAKSGTLFCVGIARLPGLRSCKNGTIGRRNCPATR
jgi:hypothetical protein